MVDGIYELQIICKIAITRPDASAKSILMATARNLTDWAWLPAVPVKIRAPEMPDALCVRGRGEDSFRPPPKPERKNRSGFSIFAQHPAFHGRAADIGWPKGQI
jgi:hypothetical protein